MMGWKLAVRMQTCVQWTLALSALAFVGCSSAPLADRSQSLARGPETERLPSSVSELTRHEQPFDGRLPLGFGARVNVFMAETAQGVGSLYSDVLKPMRTGKLFSSQPYAIDYAVRDRGDSFDEKSKLSGVEFRSSYDIRFGMSRRFHNFGDFLKTEFWLAGGKFGPAPPKLDRPSSSGWNSLFIETAPQTLSSEGADDLVETISLVDVIE
ncbi:MAG: hypothetical protein P9L94_06625 [Candidatus Hinthialibacter antarcticus]|nr:hypothetical protein [Candidatus Hinthialibacter antarcticus]